MRITSLILAAAFLFASVGHAQVEAEPANNGVHLGEPSTQLWKVGVIIKSPPGGSCGGVLATATVPTDWPEQSVRVHEEEVSPEVKRIRYRTLDNGVKQMLVAIPMLAPGRTATALVTFEVTKREILPPTDPSQFVMPARMKREISRFLGSSPFIETRHSKIRDKGRELVKDKEHAWEKVETLYDWVRDNVEYQNGPLKGAVAALRDGNGDCEELTSLFIAFCRVNKIPARTVWVPGHCYPEFYLQDKNGQGHWIPCQAAGTRDFGRMPDTRPILQKGDNFKVPEKKKPQRYVAELLKVKAVRGTGKPSVQFVRELLPAGAE